MRFPIWLAAAGSLLCVWGSTLRAATTTVYIDKDDFIDASDPNNNYGNDAKIKAVSNSGSSLYAGNTHALIELPSGYYALKNMTGVQIQSVTLSIRVGNDSLDSLHNYVELHPLTHSFTEGTGTQTPLAPTTDGATWLTYDGTNKWNTVGGDFDASNYVFAGEPGDAAGTFFTWTLTSLLNNTFSATDTASELQNGFLLKVRNDDQQTGNYFASMTSSDATTMAQRPYLTITYTPEPASLALLSGVGLLALRRKR